MFCTKCGSKVRENQMFCGKCGKAVTPLNDPVNSGKANVRANAGQTVGASSHAGMSSSSRVSALGSGFQTPGGAPSNRAIKRFRGKPGGKFAVVAVSCLIVAGLIAGSAAGYALNKADSSRTQQRGKAIPMQVVNSSHTQEQVSVGARNELENYSWDELATISDAIAVTKSEKEALRIAKDFNLVGPSGKLDGTQVKSVRLESGAVAQAQIIGFAHDVRDGGGKAGITFMFKNCIAEHQLNASNSTGGGWLHSDLRHWMNGELFNGLPDDLRNSIVAVCKSANNEGKTDSRSSVTMVSDLLWTPSFAELVGHVDMDSYEKAYERIPASRKSEFQKYFDIWNAEGSQYKLYRDSRVRMAKSNSALVKSLPTGAATTWWGRSASPGEWDRALSVTSEGRAQKSTSAPSEWLGVAPCFCVGRFGCGEARDTVPDYVDNSVTYVNPVDVDYVYVHEDNSPTINVTYIDKSTSNNVTNNETTNYVDNSIDVDADVDTSVDVGDEHQDMPILGGEDADNQGGEEGYSDEWDDGNYSDNEDGLADSWKDDREGVEGLRPEVDDRGVDEEADERGDYADDADGDGEGDDESNDAAGAGRNQDSDGDEDRKPDEEEGYRADADGHETINAGDQRTLTGTIEVRHVGDHDATMLVLPAPITVDDPENGSATSDRIGLDSSFSQYEGKRVTLRCALGVNPNGQVAPNGTTRIYAKGDVQVSSLADASGSAAPPFGAFADEREEKVGSSPDDAKSGVRDAIDKVADGKGLPFDL